MTLNFSDLIVRDNDVLNTDFFNRRFQLIVNEIAAAEAVAAQYGTISNELLQQGLTQVNQTLAPLIAQLQQAETLGFLVAPSTTSATLTASVQSNFVIPSGYAQVFQPTSFLSIQDAGNSANWALGQLQGWNASTGALAIGITYVNGGGSISGSNWVIADGAAVLPAALAAQASATSSASAAASSAAAAAASRAAADADAAALLQALNAGPVLSVAGLNGIITAAALKGALAIAASDIVSGLLTLGSSTPIVDGTAAVGTSTFAAHADHVHPTDTTRAPIVTAMRFGAGQDGNVTISSGVVTATRDMFYNNLTINGTGSLNPNGWNIYVAGTLDLSNAPANAIAMNGVAGTTATFSPESSPGGVLAATGWLTGPSTGGNGTQSSSTNFGSGWYLGSFGGRGGSITIGTAFGANVGAALPPLTVPDVDPYSVPSNVTPIAGGQGGCGGQYSSNASGGGGGGSGGGMVSIIASRINRGLSTAAGAISANGAPGGGGYATAGGHGGAGGGGGGGLIRITVGSLLGVSASGMITANGGNGGAGVIANGGAGGSGGNIIVFNVGSDTVSLVAGATGASTTTTAGGAGGACMANL